MRYNYGLKCYIIRLGRMFIRTARRKNRVTQ